MAMDFPNAQEEAEYVLQEDPKDVDARILLASSFAGQDKYEESESELNHALEISPGNAGALPGLASLKIATKHPADAETLLKLAIDKNPSLLATYLSLVNIYGGSNRSAEAEPLPC